MHARHSRGTPGDRTLACPDRLARLTVLERQTFGQDREAVVLNLFLDRRPVARLALAKPPARYLSS